MGKGRFNMPLAFDELHADEIAKMFEQRTFLLDTNILLAAVLAPEYLPQMTQDDLMDAGNTVFFSAASIWEIAIKRSLNRADFDFLPEDIQGLALETGFSELGGCPRIKNLVWQSPFGQIPRSFSLNSTTIRLK